MQLGATHTIQTTTTQRLHRTRLIAYSLVDQTERSPRKDGANTVAVISEIGHQQTPVINADILFHRCVNTEPNNIHQLSRKHHKVRAQTGMPHAEVYGNDSRGEHVTLRKPHFTITRSTHMKTRPRYRCFWNPRLRPGSTGRLFLQKSGVQSRHVNTRKQPK